ncbi:tripartite tricarboxylate transporter substrate binding protein [Cupriavidus sp. WS]|uniref:Bug family tripartite tricarboxylate transporter substrate binding protein n=1 Tax=Cupriavidus sp. WS TaxID=1312922 RepID=UPI00037CD879|nr:tripartite tricarboxylate transporter substrate binding protein [Cupriavidus sp. WS]
MLQKFMASMVMLSAAVFATSAVAEPTYPDKPIRLIVPQPPGGANDNLARIVGDKLSLTIRQPVVVDNRPGAGITVGTSIAAKSPADGYTMLMVNSIMFSASPSLYKGIPYDPVSDFMPVASLGVGSYALVVADKFPAQNFAEFIKLMKADPGKYNYSSSGIGSTPHLITEMLKRAAGFEATHVPYKGGGPSVVGLLGGEVAFTVESTSTIEPHVRAGKLRVLAVTSGQRLAQYPNVPTVAETGIPGFEVTALYSLAVPKGTPRAAVDKLGTEVARIVASPEVGRAFDKQGVQAVNLPAEQVQARIRSEVDNWSRIVKEAKIKAE